MTKIEQIQDLAHRITKLECQINDSRYFIDTALCYETRQIFLHTLASQIEESQKLANIKETLLQE
jgi:hypothetical protein